MSSGGRNKKLCQTDAAKGDGHKKKQDIDAPARAKVLGREGSETADSGRFYRAHRRLQHLYEIGKLLTKFDSVDKTIPAVIAVITRALPLRSAIFILETEGRSRSPRTIVWRAEGESAYRLRLARSHARRSYTHLVGSAAASTVLRVEPPETNEIREHAVEIPRQNFVIVPLAIGDRPIFGALQLEGATRFDELDLVFVNSVVNQLAVALDRQAAIEARAAATEVWRAETEDRQITAEAGKSRAERSEATAHLAKVDAEREKERARAERDAESGRRAEAEAAEQRARDQLDFIRTVTGSLGEGVIAVDLDSRVTLFNDAAAQMLGCTGADALGKLVQEIIQIRRKDGTPITADECPFNLAMRKGGSLRSEEQLFSSHRRATFPVAQTSAALRRDGQVSGAVLAFQDITDRKRAEEITARLASIVTSSDDAIISKNLQGIIETWNEGATRLFGYTAEEVIGRPVTLLIPADRIDEEPGILERVRHGQMVEHYETVRVRKDRTLVDISLTVSPIRDVNGRVVGASKVARDISDRKRAEFLRDSQRRALQLLAEGAPLDDVLAFLVTVVERLSPNGMLASIVTVNRSGTHFERGIGTSLPDDFNAAVEGIPVSSSTGLCANAVKRREAVTVHDFNKDVAWQPFAKFIEPYGLRSGWSAPIMSHDGQVLGTFANYYRRAGDPTPPDRHLVDMVLRTAAIAIEHKHSEDDQKRAEMEQRLLADVATMVGSSLDRRAALAAVAQTVVPLLADLCLIDEVGEDGMSERREVAFGSEEKQWDLADRFRSLAPHQGGKTPQARALETGKPVLVPEIADPAAEGIDQDERHADAMRAAGVRSMIVLPLHSRGKELGVLTFVVGDSGRRYSADDLNLAEEVARRVAAGLDNARLYEQAQRAIRAREEMLAIVSHDLKNPLSTILMSTALMGTASGDGDRRKSRKEIDRIRRAAERMNRLIQDLLDTASIDAGKLSVERRRLSVVPLVHETIEALQPLAASKSLHLHSDLPSDLPEISGDSGRLQQVFTNLVGNAIKFTPAGGTITVRAEAADGDIQFSVTDTGSGIPEESRPHLFERFWQARRTARQGTGLGLSIARGIVVAHGGRIWVESHVGEGSTFFFTLPAALHDAAEPAEAGTAVEVNSAGTLREEVEKQSMRLEDFIADI